MSYGLLRGFAVGAGVAASGALGAWLRSIQKHQARRVGEWRHLSVGPAQWGTLSLSASGILGFGSAYFFQSVHQRGDWIAFTALLLFFAAVGAIVSIRAFASRTRWNDERIEQQRFFREARMMNFKDVIAFGIAPVTRSFWCAASDGAVISISPDANGAGELIERFTGGEPPAVLSQKTARFLRRDKNSLARTS